MIFKNTIKRIKEWNNRKNKTDMKYTNSYEASAYEKNSNVDNVFNEVDAGHYGNGIQY